MKCKKWAVPQWEQNTCWSRLRFTHFIIFNDIETSWNNNILFIIREAENFFWKHLMYKTFFELFLIMAVFCAKSTLWNSEIIEFIDCNHTVWRQPTKFWILLVIVKKGRGSNLHWKTGKWEKIYQSGNLKTFIKKSGNFGLVREKLWKNISENKKYILYVECKNSSFCAYFS